MRRRIRLDELCDIRSGGTPPRSSVVNYDGSIPWAKIDDLNVENGTVSFTKECITEIGLQSIRGRLFEPGTLLFAMYGSVGKMAWAGVRLATNQAILGISVLEPQKLAPSYLKHWLASKQADFDRDANGVTQKNLSTGYIRDLEIELPSIADQLRIAAILDKADSLRRKRQEATRLADEFLKAVFYEKFGDPVTNSNRLPTSRIDQLCDVATGSTPARNRADYYDGPHPWIKTGEVDTPLITSAEECISDAAIAETNCKLFPVGTLLIAMYGQGKTRGKVGMLGIPAATNQACAAILPSQKINRHFLYTQLSLMYEHLRAMGRGGNQENLNLGMIKSLEVLVPPVHLVDDFLKVRQKVSEMTSKARRAQAESEELAQSLTAKSFS
jgi:type I restriction enzyme S subunit